MMGSETKIELKEIELSKTKSNWNENLPSYANLMSMHQSCIWPILCQLMAILTKFLDFVFV